MTNHGFGEPRFIFYPPLSWMLGAALILLLPDAAVPIVFVVLIQTIAGLAAWFLLRRLASPRAALLAAGLYVINPNALLITYNRSDFAEQLACALFPLVLLAALRLCDLLDDSPPKASSIAVFALSFATVWLCNAPAGVIASYTLALLFAWAALSQRSARILLRGMGGLALGFGLASFYLVPAACEQPWVNISQALSSGLLPSQNFLFTSISDVEHTWFNWIASICALLLTMLCGLAALASRRFSSKETFSVVHRRLSRSLLVLGSAATLLMLKLTSPLWNLLPKLRYVQFPWRWMSVIALVSVCFLAFILQNRRGWLWFAAIFALTVTLAIFLATNAWWDDEEMPTLRDAVTSGRGFEGTDEYDPLGDDHLDLPPDAPLVKVLPTDAEDSAPPPVHAQIQRWTTEQKTIHVDALSPARLALRLLNYPAWNVEVNGKRISPGRRDDVNRMVIPVEAGSSEIRIQLVRTLDRTIGNTVSAFSGVLSLFLLWVGRKQRRATA